MNISARKFIVLVTATAALAFTVPSSGWCENITDTDNGDGFRLLGSVTAGFDSFQDRYSIVDRDTLDSIDEFRTGVRVGLMAGTFMRDFLLLEGRAQYSDNTYETEARFRFAKLFRSGYSGIGFETNFTRRTFGDNSSYQFPNDYGRLQARVYIKHRINSLFSLRLMDRLEFQNFDDRTEFDYDYRRNRLSIGGEVDWDLTTSLNARFTYTTMDIPDSAEVEYDSYTSSFEFSHFADLHKRATVQTSIERREYAAGSPRSRFWAFWGDFAGEWSFSNSISVLMENDTEWYSYDFKDNVYFDYVENHTALMFRFIRSFGQVFGGGPTFGILDSNVSTEDGYMEYGAKCTVEYMKGTSLWISAEYEPGVRKYTSFDNSPETTVESLFSNYKYHRLSVFLNYRIWDGVTFGGFADYQPEDHEREGDDSTITLISLSLTYAF